MVAPNTHLISRRSLEERLIESMRETGSGCWEWTRATTAGGYGRMSYQNHVYRVHRLAAHLWLGLDLADSITIVCHHCDNPTCFNPEHLYLGDQKSNVADMVNRGRNYKGPPKWDHCAKGHPLTDDNLVGKKNPRCRKCAVEYLRSRRATCPECGVETAATALKRHMARKHPTVRAVTAHIDTTPKENDRA